MHEYYAKNKAKLKKDMNKMLFLISGEFEKASGKRYTYPDSFKTKTKIPPEAGYDFSFHNIACPLANFAKQYGYEGYMPYLCNLDYVMLGVMEIPLFREHTCFEDGDYCDFKIKWDEKPMKYVPPVFKQGKGYK